ncbi:MAG: F0F1 ATP synthase subunit B [Dermatophilaceae bacterium]
MVLLTVPAAGDAGPGWPSALPLLPHPAEMLIGLIAFGLMYWVFSSKVVPSMEKMYSERKDAIEGDMTRAERALDEANDLKRQYEAQLSDARTEAARVREEAREQGAAIIAEMRDQAQAESARILDSTQRQIHAERTQAINELKGDVGRLSTDLASRIVGESLHDEARQTGIVERFIADLEAGRVAAGRGEHVREAIPKEVDV